MGELALVILRALVGIVAAADLGAHVVMGRVLFERSEWDVASRGAKRATTGVRSGWG